ncbi:MAG: phosphoribosylamine--glycine ligase [Candidatus Wildermuthbacteria bacterium]|nr:phosphoribosylamine--glycine ligase [Candidatus Wildermuthbacteria bacterium]
MVSVEEIQRVAIVGGPGGREAAIEKRLLEERPHLTIIHIPVMSMVQLVTNIAKAIPDFVIAGSEAPLVQGLANSLKGLGIPCFGPTQQASQLEGSKAFAISRMKKCGVGHPRSFVVSSMDDARVVILSWPVDSKIVVKADGLASGKGVTIARTKEEALHAVGENFKRYPGLSVVLQEFVAGFEMSVFGFTDGNTVSSLVSAEDYKQRSAKDSRMTGGMGAYAPHRLWTPELEQQIRTRVFLPMLQEMREPGIPYRGVLYAGLMLILNEGGEVSDFVVLEFNCRFGDPEAQVILPLLKGDFLALMHACVYGGVAQVPLRWDNDTSVVAVVIVTPGYPGQETPETQAMLEGLALHIPDKLYRSARWSNAYVLKSSKVQKQIDGTYRIVGSGRVLTVVARNKSMWQARNRALSVVRAICSQAQGLLSFREDVAEF